MSQRRKRMKPQYLFGVLFSIFIAMLFALEVLEEDGIFYHETQSQSRELLSANHPGMGLSSGSSEDTWQHPELGEIAIKNETATNLASVFQVSPLLQVSSAFAQSEDGGAEKTEAETSPAEIELPEELKIGNPDYPKVGYHAGVHNDGQAALWDLDILDFYRIFGAEERARGYGPKQPIGFSHVTHNQKLGMNCTYCHWTVNKSTYAAIPEVETCMGCHKWIDHNPANSPEVIEYQKQEIGKIRDYYAKGEAIPWEKVHVMPNHVKFNHKRHVKAGVSCQSCHGQIPEMPVVERVSSMKMGWCLDCHRQQGASIDCATCHY